VDSRTKYVGLGIIFLASLAAAAFFHYFPVSVLADLAGIPAIAALFGALFLLARDSIAYERSLHLEETKNRFTVGATSHMANLAFDKHVEFCEAYTDEVNVTLAFLFRRGPHQDVLQRANALAEVRTKWSLWLTSDMEERLLKFEGGLRTIGANAHLLEGLNAEGEERTEAVQNAYSTFAAVLGWENWHGQPVSSDLAAERVIIGLRDVLGISELTRLRSELIRRATGSLD
jgi:hypothetical protein